MVGQGHRNRDHQRQEVILRHATTDDESALEAFDLGDIRSQWLDEVAEIVSGLVAWRDDAEHLPLDRQVVIAETEGEIVAVAAHERVEHERLGPLSEHRIERLLHAREILFGWRAADVIGRNGSGVFYTPDDAERRRPTDSTTPPITSSKAGRTSSEPHSYANDDIGG